MGRPGVDVGLNDQERSLVELATEFAQRELAPIAGDYEERGEEPPHIYRKLAELGLTGIPFDPDFGGGGMLYRAYLPVIEELARAWVAIAIGLGVHTLACDAVARFGGPEIKEKLLSSMLVGERFGAYALSEPSSGSDAGALRTRAWKIGGGYAISGRKQFCTRGGEADVVLLMARTGEEGPKGISAFVVQKDTDGFRPTRTEDKMGWRSSPTWELTFEDCHVPEYNRIGEEGEGFRIAMAALDSGRLGIAATSTGLAQAALDAAVRFASEREQFGSMIFDFQGIQFMLADMATSVEAGRALHRRAVDLKDAGDSFTKEAAMAKLFCSDVAMSVTTDAVQIHGGYGYIEDYAVERYMREAKALQIVEGTNQIQRMIIAREMGTNR